MPASSITAVCPACSARFAQVPRRSFLGFQKLTCTACGKPVTYPLTTRFRIAMWVFAAIVVVGAFATARQGGGIATPGLLFVVAVAALIRDSVMRKRVRETVPIPELHAAAAEGNQAKVEALLESSVDANVKDKTGATALMYAARNGHLDVVHSLLARGADSSCTLSKGESALSIATKHGHHAVVKLLNDSKARA